MEALGIEPKLLLAQVINFLIVLFILRKFAYSPILDMLQKRSKTIATGLKNSEEAEKKLQEATEKQESILEKTYKEANEILANAKKEAKEEAEKLIKSAENQAVMIRKTALEEAANLKERAISEAKMDLSKLVILALEKVTGQAFKQKDREQFVSKAIEEL